MSLNDLATETIEFILHASIPESFENLAQTCKWIYQASASYRDEYNTLSKKYRQWVLDAGPGPAKLAIELLMDIAENPIIARYVRYADLKHKFRRYGSMTSGIPLAEISSHVRNSSKCLALIEQSVYLRDANQQPHIWSERIIREIRNSTTCAISTITFLLTLLPNVRELSLPETWDLMKNAECKDDILAVLAVCAQKANNTSLPYAGLSNLATLLPSRIIDFSIACQFQDSIPFLTIRNVREFYCTGCTATKEGLDRSLLSHFPDIKFNLEILELGGCCLTHAEFVTYLSYISALRIFKFSFDIKDFQGIWAWDPAAFVVALERSHGETLEELSLSILGDGCRELVGTGISSMKNFRRLKTLELDVRLLLGRRFNNPDQYYPRPERALAPCDGIELPRLIDLLPESIETVHLIIDQENGRSCMERLITDFQDKKDQLLPKLSHVVIRCQLAKNPKPMNEEEFEAMFAKNALWIRPAVEALRSLEVELLEESTFAYYERGYSEARFMTDIRMMYTHQRIRSADQPQPINRFV